MGRTDRERSQAKHWEMTVTLREPDPRTAKLALDALWNLMAPDLQAMAERMGVPMMAAKSPLSAEEYARRHARIKQFVLDNPWDTPIPEGFGREDPI